MRMIFCILVAVGLFTIATVGEFTQAGTAPGGSSAPDYRVISRVKAILTKEAAIYDNRLKNLERRIKTLEQKVQ